MFVAKSGSFKSVPGAVSPVAQHGLPTGQRRQRSGVGPKYPRPEPDRVYIGKFVQDVKLRLVESALGADQDRPGRAAVRLLQQIVDRRGVAGLGAKQDMACGRPVIENSRQRPGVVDARDGQAFALFGGLDRVGLHTLAPDALDDGAAGHGRQQRRYTELRRLAHQEIQRRALDRREDQPEIGFGRLRTKPASNRQIGGFLADPVDMRQPFAIAAVEQRHPRAGIQTQHVAQVMGLVASAFHRRATGKIAFDEQPRPGSVGHAGKFLPVMRR